VNPKAKLFAIAASAIAIGVLPVKVDLGGFAVVQAFAKGGNGNGGGSGHGGGNGGSDHGGGSSSRDHGGGKSSSGKSSSGKSSASAGKSSHGKAMKQASSSAGKKSQKLQVAAVDPETVKQKNLHARLGSLNSLKRNVNAYLNSKSAKFAEVQAYVLASAQHDLLVEAVDKASETLAEEQGKLTDLQGELDRLNTMTQAEIDALSPEDQAAREARITELGTAIPAQQTVVDGATTALGDAQAAEAEGAIGTDDATLEAALLDMSNKQDTAPIDPEVLDWAKTVLGVGDAEGKIDQVRATLEPET
jgi:chromosome segregation ATPase